MADGKTTASKPKSLLPMAWAVFVAALAGVLLWLNGTAEDTVSDLYERADKESLRTVAELTTRPDASEPDQSADEAPVENEAAEPDDQTDTAESTGDVDGDSDSDGQTESDPAEIELADGGDADVEPVESNDGAVTADVSEPDEPENQEQPETTELAETPGAAEESDTLESEAPAAANGLQQTPDDPAAVAALADTGAEETQLALVEPPAPDTAEVLDEDLPAWQANSRPFEAPDEQPRIAIVITDLGLSAAATQIAIQDLPGEVTLAFAAHAPDLDSWIPQTRAAGHEALVMVPMEPEDYPVSDPGPYTLLTSQAPSTNIDRLDWSLRRATGFVGIIDTKGSRFTSVPDAVQPVVEEIGNRGLLVLDSGSEASVMPAVARETQVPVTASDALITDFASGNAIDLRLAELEAIAQDNGSAVGIAFPYPILFDRLKGWIEGLDDKGIVLAPITAVVDSPE